jgi:hypothetical protein
VASLDVRATGGGACNRINSMQWLAHEVIE